MRSKHRKIHDEDLPLIKSLYQTNSKIYYIKLASHIKLYSCSNKRSANCGTGHFMVTAKFVKSYDKALNISRETRDEETLILENFRPKEIRSIFTKKDGGSENIET